ncbi:hypothetical protein K505DRAFT_323320 [Melanomma pulvis-pyrius CBS 109.77]|uniref:Histone chaperone domain-containing protein n=1 Tax=Melanomma pulvis-pyrius CBS 109.77 TaxID=1314802 RepID=A0A6A6XK42_9PLEO|nr:hypothetical protein K505DRAFT_323320 [Melanomma pulvis-pyrius CBS 109.77]
MADRSTDHAMEDVEHPAGAVDKGKGKAPDAMEESADDDSSDDSGVEDHPAAEPEDEDNMEEIDTTNIVASRTRGKNIDFTKAAQELGDDEDEEDDEDFVEPAGDDAMEE